MVSSDPFVRLSLVPTSFQNQAVSQAKSKGCPYHAQVLSPKQIVNKDTYGKGVMDRFLSEGPNESGAVFNRPDNNKVSIDKGCTCGKNEALTHKL